MFEAPEGEGSGSGSEDGAGHDNTGLAHLLTLALYFLQNKYMKNKYEYCME